jgi:Tfp pilus assembly PilM family ATPase
MQPFKNIKIPKKFDMTYLEEVAPVLSIAAGLALRRPADR